MDGAETQPACVRVSAALLGVLCLLVGLLWASGLRAQSPDEHASHHPGQTADAAPAAATMPAGAASPAPPATPGGAGGMMEGMGEMMKGMGGAKTKELYPSLMDLPDLPLAKRHEVEQQAGERMHSGVALMNESLAYLLQAASAQNYTAMQAGTASLREGLARFESGLAAQRALAEGKAPRNVALTWFKRDMNLLPLPGTDAEHSGLGIFHWFVMALLTCFFVVMSGMYFYKMRRAAALFGRLEGGGSGQPPPGSSPPLAGTPVPATPAPPPVGTAPPDGGTPPPAAPTSTAPAMPATGGSSAVLVSQATSAPPLTANWRGQLRVGSIVTETPSVKTFRLRPLSSDSLMPFTFVPGQFLNVAFWIGGARMNRSYSISSSPTQRDYVDLTVRREPRGAISRHMYDLLKVGDQIEAGGPIGRFTFAGTEADSIVLIAAGVGITPMMSIARYLTERSWPGEIFVLYSCRVPTDFIFQQEIATLQRLNPKLHVVVTMSRPEGTDWQGSRGRLTKELLTQTVPNLASRRIHVCGPQSMMDSTKALLIELGVAPGQVKTELFGATKPTPAAAGTYTKPTVRATGPLVTFSQHHKSANIHVDQTVLELSEELAIGIENSCRVGTCGVCKVKMTSGEVEMTVEDSLDPGDKANGIILACQAKPKGDIAVAA